MLRPELVYLDEVIFLVVVVSPQSVRHFVMESPESGNDRYDVNRFSDWCSNPIKFITPRFSFYKLAVLAEALHETTCFVYNFWIVQVRLQTHLKIPTVYTYSYLSHYLHSVIIESQ